MTPTRKLTAIALVIAFIQFTNALEYMVFNPIFLYMAADFSVPVSYAGYVSAAYTLAAVISGIGAFYWIGGVEKRRFLLLNVALLGVTTLLIAATQQFYWLLALRLLAGLLGGTTMGVGIGLLLNAAPAALHGRMLATVIASFSLVSIVGMPGMLYLCEVASWRAALVTIGGLCLLAAVWVALFVPRDAPQPQAAAPVTLDRRLLLFASAAGLTQFSPMLLIPVLAIHFVFNLGLSMITARVAFHFRDVQQFLVEHARLRLADAKRAARLPGEIAPADETTWRYVFEAPEDILIVCAGGRAGSFLSIAQERQRQLCQLRPIKEFLLHRFDATL